MGAPPDPDVAGRRRPHPYPPGAARPHPEPRQRPRPGPAREPSRPRSPDPARPLRGVAGNRSVRLGYLVVVAVLVAGLLAWWLVVSPSGDEHGSAPRPVSAAPPSTPSASVQAAATWTKTNLPPGTRVVAPPDVVASLNAAGLHAVTGCAGDGFVLATASLRTRARTEPELAGCLATSLAVARFGRGVDLSEVRQITTDPAATSRARQAALADRRRGGSALATNRAISMPAAVRSAMLAGALDLRAQTVIAALATNGPLRIRDVVSDPAEALAGLPARVVDIDVGTGPALNDLLPSLAPGYRPASITPNGSGTFRLTWPFRATPPPVLN
jgi:hypothetical protein